jgi:SNF2 family DNA or RNA helicase
MDEDGVAYEYLDGSTKDRAERVDNFQRDDGPPVFLISLKAGGSGLNLTAADTVIHFDPWWNPAVEDQATDRAHRIGQTKVVTTYRLIAKGTIEEKILELGGKKRELVGRRAERGRSLRRREEAHEAKAISRTSSRPTTWASTWGRGSSSSQPLPGFRWPSPRTCRRTSAA